MILFELLEKSEKEIELEEVYSDSITKMSKLLNSLDLNNNYEKFYCFCYLLWNGYFSVEHNYVYDAENIKDEKYTIFLGKGCCRHNSSLLTDVLRKEYVLAKTTKVQVSKIKLKDVPKIKRVINKNNERNHFSSERDINHAVTSIHEEERLLLLDPTNLMMCEVLKKARLKSFNGTFTIDRSSLIEELSRIGMEIPSYSRATLKKSEIIESYRNAHEVYKNNQQLLNDFYIDNHRNYEKIKKLVIGER